MIDSALFRWPETVADAVDRLLFLLEPELLAQVADSEPDDVAEFNGELSLAISKGFGLWHGNQALLDDCRRWVDAPPYQQEPGEPSTLRIHPDDAAYVILSALWDRLCDPI